MKVFSLLVLTCTLLTVSLVNGAESNIFWESNFSTNLKTWKSTGVSKELLDNSGLRLRESGKKSYGKLGRYISTGKGYNYIQIKMGHFEHGRHGASVGNASSKGRTWGYLNSGWNTFLLSPHLRAKSTSFYLSLYIFGNAGTKLGGWMDLQKIRIVKKPYDGITVKLIPANDRKDNIAKIGDSILIQYFSTGISEKEISVKCYYVPTMQTIEFGKDILLSDQGKNGDIMAGDGIYSCKIKIPKNVSSVTRISKKTGKQVPVYPFDLSFVAIVNGEYSYTCPNFETFFNTNVKLQGISLKGFSPLSIKKRALWIDKTRGKNLAAGKKVKFSIKPNYYLTSPGNNDEYNLTDGTLTVRKNGTMWFDSNAVAWENISSVDCVIDLGKECSVSKVVARCQGGGRRVIMAKSPKRFELSVSLDGKKYYKAASMIKLAEGEKNQSDFISQYYVEEIDKDFFVHPFEFKLNCKARYINLRIIPSGNGCVLDEIAVIEQEKSELVNKNFPYDSKAFNLIFDGIVTQPADGDFVISSNLPVPNFLSYIDLRTGKDRQKAFKQVIELPEEIDLLFNEGIDDVQNTPVKQEKITRNGKKYIRWTCEVSAKRAGYFYRYYTWFFKLREGAGDVSGETAYFYVSCEGVKPNYYETPIKIVKFPELDEKLKRACICLSWMTLGINYPDFFKSWRKLGFNTISIDVSHRARNKEWKKLPVMVTQMNLLEKARNYGFKIMLNYSAFHIMVAPFKNIPDAEVFTQYLDKSKRAAPCPSYRGKFYQKEMDDIARCVKEVRPEYVVWDIELWNQGAKDASKCSRCVRAMRKSGESMDNYLRNCGKQTNRDLAQAVKRGAAVANIKLPEIYSYNRHSLIAVYHIISEYKKISEYLAGDCPSLYVAGNALLVHDTIRGNYRMQKDKSKRTILPMLTAGTYGKYPAFKLEQMIYETMLNGGGGIQYYSYTDFTPMHFYYHSKAIKNLSQFEDLIFDGKVLEPTGSNKKHTYSAIANSGEMLLLIGNYRRVEENTTCKLPFNKVKSIKDVISGKMLVAKNKLTLNVPKGQVRLLYIQVE